MFIKQLDPTLPPSFDDSSDDDNLSKADNFIVEIKVALKDTFPNFHNSLNEGEPITYSVVDLYGMYKFITANATDLLYKGPTVGTIKNVLAVTKDKVVYCRPPRSMFFTVLWFRLTQAQLDTFYPNTYVQLKGNKEEDAIQGTTLNALLGGDYTTVNIPDLKNRYLRGSLTSGNPTDESLKLDSTSLKLWTDSTKINKAPLSFGGEHFHRITGGPSQAGTSRTASPVCTWGYDSSTDEVSQSASPQASITTGSHNHDFINVATNITNFNVSKDTALEQKIRPATYNLYPFMRVN
jgi:hypothetical protein